MLNKLRVIWKLLWADEWFLLTNRSLHASYRETNIGKHIKILSKKYAEELNQKVDSK